MSELEEVVRKLQQSQNERFPELEEVRKLQQSQNCGLSELEKKRVPA